MYDSSIFTNWRRSTHYQQLINRWGTSEILLVEEGHRMISYHLRKRRQEQVSCHRAGTKCSTGPPIDLGFKFLTRISTCFHCFLIHNFCINSNVYYPILFNPPIRRYVFNLVYYNTHVYLNILIVGQNKILRAFARMIRGRVPRVLYT